MLAGRQRPLQSFGLGLAFLLLVPIAGLFVAITIIGLPLALAVGLLYGLALLLAWPAVGLLLGVLISWSPGAGSRCTTSWRCCWVWSFCTWQPTCPTWAA